MPSTLLLLPALLALAAARGAAPAAAPARAAAAEEEPVLLVPVLENGSFAEEPTPGLPGIPWWSVVAGAPAVVATEEGPALHLPPGAAVAQPCAAYAPLLAGAVVRGSARGEARLVVSGGGARAVLDVGAAAWTPFEIPFAEVLARAPEVRPRLVLELRATEAAAAFRDVALLAPLPCPSEDALRAEVLGHVRDALHGFLELSLDDAGPRATAFPAFDFDAVTGARLDARGPVGDAALAWLVLRLWRAAPEPEWERWLERFLDDYLALCLHPETGLERRWDPLRDVPLDELAIEIHKGLELLVDVAESGPAAYRARALAAAERMARTVLARGVLPDESVAAVYRPARAEPRTDYPPLRRLDVPAQLARVAAATSDAALAEELRRAARDACLAFEYAHYWPGDWQWIDPGFDDDFGHYGARAVDMWEALPDEPAFRAIAGSGFERYAPLWRDALRYGGNVASDQVRCWRIFARIGRLEPQAMPTVRALLSAAVASHFKGQQLSNGAWTDTTIRRFDPVSLPVGDTYGVPQTLIEGLGLAYRDDLGLRTPEVRAMLTAALRTTVETSKEAHGFRSGGARPDGTVPAWEGSGRFAYAAVELLESLAR